MSKFSGSASVASKSRTVRPSAIQASNVATVTYEGAPAWSRDPKSDLFLLAATSLVEDKFYESTAQQSSRLRDLVTQITNDDPAWIVAFVPYLRNVLNMRSVSVQVACEYVHAGGPNGRGVIASACSRADEPAEIIGYWRATFGRNLPMPVKRGVADVAIRLYSERNAIKYDGQGQAIRFGDVIDIVHPKPKDDRQSALFHYLLDKRHNRPEITIPPVLKTLGADAELQRHPVQSRRAFLTGDPLLTKALSDAAMTWERLSGWLQGPMDADAWQSVIPEMGYMALLRNLRNFDQADIDKPTREYVKAKLSDPEEVRKSRQFPYRFWSAYRFVESVHWHETLEEALDIATENVPKLVGRTLVLVDVSGSMNVPVSDRSQILRWEIGAVFAGSVVKACDEVTLVPFATTSLELPFSTKGSTLRAVEAVNRVMQSGELQHGTQIWEAVRAHYNAHDRVVIFTDMQTMDSEGRCYGDKLNIPRVYGFNLAGYQSTIMRPDLGRYEFGGFSDATFKMMALLERDLDAPWPWLIDAPTTTETDG